MRIEKITDREKGWICGDFPGALLRLKEAEFAVKYYKPNDYEPSHHHKIATEITVVASGIVRMGFTELGPGDIVILEPGESTDFYAVTRAITCVFKTPSVPEDKYID